MSRDFNYDATDISAAYATARRLTPERRRAWWCGVGRFAPLLHEVFRARVYGIDPLERMLEVAGANPEAPLITWVRASGEALPIARARIDLVFLYLVYHHLRDPLTALRECARVLVSDGHLLVINDTAEILDSIRWFPFFPSACQIDLARLPTRADVSRVAEEAGLTLIRQGTGWRREPSRRCNSSLTKSSSTESLRSGNTATAKITDRSSRR